MIQDIDKESNVHVFWVEPINDFLCTLKLITNSHWLKLAMVKTIHNLSMKITVQCLLCSL